MARYIDADLLTDKLEELQFNAPVMTPVMKIYNVIELVEDQPTADVEEVKHGEWIYNTDDFTPKMRCSVCGYNKPLVAGAIEQEPNDYCNKCGAKMDGGKAE